jgi:hypothetical protein
VCVFCLSDAECDDPASCDEALSCSPSVGCLSDGGTYTTCKEPECAGVRCDELEGCVYDPAPDGTACDGGRGLCVAGTCTPSSGTAILRISPSPSFCGELVFLDPLASIPAPGTEFVEDAYRYPGPCGDGLCSASKGFGGEWARFELIGRLDVRLIAYDSAGGIATTVVSHEVLSRPPVADAGPDLSVGAGATVVLDGGGSTDPDNLCADRVDRWEWDVDGDGSFELSSPVAVTAVTAPGPGSHVVTLRVTDRHGVTDTDTLTLTVL